MRKMNRHKKYEAKVNKLGVVRIVEELRFVPICLITWKMAVYV
jgi:hypothetical protein